MIKNFLKSKCNAKVLKVKIIPKDTEDLLFLIENDADELIEQTKTRPEGNLEIKLIKSSENFSINTPLNLEGKWFLGVASSEVFNTIFDTNEENNIFTIQVYTKILELLQK